MDEAAPALDAWEGAFAAYHARFAFAFARAEPRTRSHRYLRALLAPVERKNGWQLAEAMGESDPLGAQRLLYEAVWDADAVRDAYQQFVIDQFGDPDAVLVLDETGFLKKGTKSVGVQRQYSGTAGKVENCQLGVFLAYVTARGHVLLDRRLYLPQGWAEDPDRRARAHVPPAVTFATMPQLGLAMLDHAQAQGVVAAWVTADERYGGDPAFRAALEARGQRYVLAVPCTTPVWPTGTRVVARPDGVQVLRAPTPDPVPVAAEVATWPPEAWQRLAVAAGAKGPREYDWAAARVPVSAGGWPGPECWLLARRSVSDPTEVAYYLAHAPADTPLRTLARVAAQRWPVEQCFEEAKGEAGLDQYEVRGWPSWHRHITLAMLAHAFLAWQRQEAGKKSPARGTGPAQCAGVTPAASNHAAAPSAVACVSAGVVALATAPPSAGPPGPLSSGRSPPQAPRPYLRL